MRKTLLMICAVSLTVLFTAQPTRADGNIPEPDTCVTARNVLQGDGNIPEPTV